MGYQHGKTTRPALTSEELEQARQRRAAMQRELLFLDGELVRLQEAISQKQVLVTAARRRLSRRGQALVKLRAEIQHLNEATIEPAPVPDEPLFGGRAGLEAAAAEMAAHDSGKAKVTFPKRRWSPGASHGTRQKYEQGCSCGECLGWRQRKSDRERERIAAARAARRAA